MREKTILVTGSSGFIGKNLCVALSRRQDVNVLCFDANDDPRLLKGHLAKADIIYHLAGVNRPQNVAEFAEGNTGLTQSIISILDRHGRTPAIIMSSSTQAELNNPYGLSKKEAEDILFAYAAGSGAPVYVYRLTNVFGKWSRPNYNSVVSTFCYNIAHGLEITFSDPANELELVYIDDVVTEFIAVLAGKREGPDTCLGVGPTYRITLAELAERIYRFRDIRATLEIPDLSDDLTRKLHATYLSYLEPTDFSYPLEIKSDNRGELAELIKSAQFGQMFVSRTHGGITRGNHHHDTKVEKFCVLQGEAVIRFRHLFSEEVIEYKVSGLRWEVVDIPPGYTHHIENLSDSEMIVLFWANQVFNPEKPDTYFCEVQYEKD
jgi:UDP-2-acetamido-2,6-beta-L-arabino-hexul-4-ose reductase